MKTWLKITLVTAPVLVEPLSDFLVGVIGSGVEVDQLESSSQQIIKVYVDKESPTAEEVQQIINRISDYAQEMSNIFKVETPQLDHELIGEEDWGQTWKKHFSPYYLTPHLVVAPTWEKYEVQEEEKVMVMDPGMAFGTGHHATTSLVAQFMEEEILKRRNDRSVLDVGTGTGILGMAAALFGAKEVFGIDNDPVAVQIARENCRMNNLSGIMQVSEEPLENLTGHHSLVVANIIHDVLLSMSADLQRLTEIGGKLVLSGLLAGTQAESAKAVYERCGFILEELRTQQEWAALLMRRKS
ncbi:MAG: 50S ribosomal protein L11 methyltransferase [Desulfocapsaceae bacterium]|nr:50S ribosomal protein L11 methyltransferase [Desulfocapsaceae bacterium]